MLNGSENQLGLLKAQFPVAELPFGPHGMLDMRVGEWLATHWGLLNLEHTTAVHLMPFLIYKLFSS